MLKKLRHLLKNSRAAVAVEFALMAPVFIGLLLTTVETAYYLMLHTKLQSASMSVGDLITRDETISEGIIIDLFNVVDEIIDPYQTGPGSKAIVSAIGEVGNQPRIIWQREGAGTLNIAASIGGVGDTAQLPDGFIIRNGETIIITELYFTYQPIIVPFIGTSQIKKVGYHRPRLSTLQEIQP